VPPATTEAVEATNDGEDPADVPIPEETTEQGFEGEAAADGARPVAAGGQRIPGSGLLGGRGKEGRARALEVGATKEAQAAVDDGLAWLARAQERDGHWDGRRWEATQDVDMGVTGLALLAFLGDGHTHKADGPYKSIIARGLQWILTHTADDGEIQHTTMYEQGIGTMVLSEAYALTRDPALKKPAQRAIDYTLSQMGADGGYGYIGAGNDTSVTGFQIMAIKSAQVAGLKVPAGDVTRVRGYLDKSCLVDGRFGYRHRAEPSTSMTSVGLFCRLLLGMKPSTPQLRASAGAISDAGVDVNNEYFTYYATFAMFQMGGDAWTRWNAAFRDPVIALQLHAPDALRGSWSPGTNWFSQRGGRVYVTAMYILALEVYQRYLPLYR